MYDLISGIIDHSWATSTNEQSYIYYICGSLIIILTITFIDFIYRTFRSFWGR